MLTNHQSLTYARFLNLAQAIRDLPKFPQLDAVEDRVLNVFAAAWSAGRKVTVLEAMTMVPDASPSTVHRRMKSLRKKNMIALEHDPDDIRMKYVVPTALTNDYFESFANCLDQALTAP